jgi:glyoxylase-like metal-dependent hydrolase (beta-lactamase superfamily II)
MTDLVFDRDFAISAGRVETLSPLVRRVVANNPSAFTFRGTSSFIVGRGEVAVIDPGPPDEAHLAALLEALRGETVNHILVTHSHADHSPLAAALQRATGARTYGYGQVMPPAGSEALRLDASIDHAFRPDVQLADGDTLAGPGWTLDAVFTPGHMSNHMCFALREERTLFSGDHVMAWATSVIAPPDGDMARYFASLGKLLERDDQIYHPGHGPSRQDPLPLVRGYLTHRRMREEAIRASVVKGARQLSDVVAAVYAGIDPALHPAAALSARAHLEHLVAQGRLRVRDDLIYEAS